MPRTIATTLFVILAALEVALAAEVGARHTRMVIVRIVTMVLMAHLRAICEELNALASTSCLVRHAGATTHCQHLGTTNHRGGQLSETSLHLEKRRILVIAEQTLRRVTLVAPAAVPIAGVGVRITYMTIIAQAVSHPRQVRLHAMVEDVNACMMTVWDANCAGKLLLLGPHPHPHPRPRPHLRRHPHHHRLDARVAHFLLALRLARQGHSTISQHV